MVHGKWWAITSALLLASLSAVAQVPTPIRSVSALPATCKGGNPAQSSDMVILITASVGTTYICDTPNHWSIVQGTGGGNISPGTNAGQNPVWDTGLAAWEPQNKAIYDMRDWAHCDGATDVSVPIGTLLSTIGTQNATINVVGFTTPSAACVVQSLNFPKNVTLDFSGGGSFSLINSIIPPGGALLDGTAAGGTGTTSTSCSFTLNVPTAGDMIFLGEVNKFVTSGGVGVPTDDKGNLYRLIFQSNADTNHFQSNSVAWIATNVQAGATTITIPYTVATNVTCGAAAFTGLGLSIGLDSSAFCNNSCRTDSPMTTITAGTYTAGSLLLGFGGEGNTTETCTAGAGFTLALNVGTNKNFCLEYQLSAAGGPVTATTAISGSTSQNWMFASIGLKPTYPTLGILGGLVNPHNRQIFFNATSTATVDFLGNLVIDTVRPEWWGAGGGASSTVNTAALQAAEHGAFGTSRTNTSGLQAYNKRLLLSQMYRINGELQFYHVIGTSSARTTVECIAGGGIIQTATNARIIDGQSVAYFQSKGCWWQGTASSTAPLIDYDFSAAQGDDLRPQFIDHYGDTFVGSNLVDTGVLIAKSGGGAQGSNIYCHNCESSGFTGAAWQIGGNNTGRNVGRNYAQNAIDIGYDGDIQGCTLYGIAVYGGGYVGFGSANRMSSMENNFFTQTGYDIYGEATQGPVVAEHFRSESRRLIAGSNIILKDVKIINQAQQVSPLGAAGNGSIYTGDAVSGDGAYYLATTPGTFGGVQFTYASGGSGTTLTDTNQNVVGSVTQGAFVTATELMTQATTGSTGTRFNLPASTGTITGSVTTGTIGASHTMTQAVTGITCTSTNAPTGVQSLTCNNFSGTADNSHIWTDGTTSGTYTPTAAPTFSSTTMIISAATGAPDNSHNWVGGTTGAVFTPTAVPVANAAWTVNAFIGMLVSNYSGTNLNCYGVITANAATSITVAAGWVTKYPFTACPGPALGTTFAVMPGWNLGTVNTGTAVLTYQDDDVIGAATGGVGFVGRIEDVIAPGGRFKPWTNPTANVVMKNVTVSRADWLRSPGNNPQQPTMAMDWDVHVIPMTSISGATSNGLAQLWAYPSTTGVPFTGAFHQELGAKALCWSTGTINITGPPDNKSASEICVGGRSDYRASNVTFRNRFEIPGGAIGGVGTATIFGTDKAGTDTNIFAGGSTGAGASGAINFWISQVGASSDTPNDGTKTWLFNGSGHLLAATDNTFDIGAVGATRPRDFYLARNATVGGALTVAGSSSISTGTASNTDLAGQLTLSIGTITYTFAGTYISAPICVATDVTAVLPVQVSVTTTVLTINGTGSDVVNYLCIGRN